MAARRVYTIVGLGEKKPNPSVDVHQFKSDNSDDDEHDRKETDNMVRVSEENNSCHDGSGSADPGPDGICRSYGDGFHRLRNRKEAHHNENNGDDARNELAKSLAVFKGNGKADFKKSCQ